MRYMFFVIAPPSDGPPPQALMDAMTQLIEKRTADGSLIDTGGLFPIQMGARISLKRGEINVIDGPFAESKEVVGGYAIFEFATRAEALASAVEFMEVHRDHAPGWEGVCEMRPMVGAEDPNCGMGDSNAA